MRIQAADQHVRLLNAEFGLQIMYDAKENIQLSVNVLVGDDNTVKLLESYGLTVSK